MPFTRTPLVALTVVEIVVDPRTAIWAGEALVLCENNGSLPEVAGTEGGIGVRVLAAVGGTSLLMVEGATPPQVAYVRHMEYAQEPVVAVQDAGQVPNAMGGEWC